MDYIYTIDTGSNIYVWKWIDNSLTDAYKNMKASKLRQRENRKNPSKNNMKNEPNTEEQEDD